ncbi:MAG: serine--tRNA ligase, partial [bacterium]|nr:serine--tRNA ligase [bacterium]
MIDLNDLRQRPDAYKKAAKDKNLTIDIDAFFALDDKRKKWIPEVEEARAKQNEASKKIPQLKGG